MPIINIDTGRGGFGGEGGGGGGGLFGNDFGMPSHRVSLPGDAGLRPMDETVVRPKAIVNAWIAGDITFEELQEALPNEEFRNRLLNAFGYDSKGNSLELPPDGLKQGESTWGDIADALLEAGYDQEFIDELLYDPENGVIFDRTNQNAVTLENILGNLTGENWDVLQLPTEAEYGTFRADMDGDGVYDTVVRCTSGAGSACALEDYQVVYGAEVDISDPEVQDQIRNAAIYEEAQNTEGWEDLEDWEKNKVLEDSGYTGPFVFGDGSTMPPDEPEAEQDSSVIEQIKEKFPTWEDIWNEIKDSAPSNPQEVGDLIRGVLEAVGIQLPTDTAIPDILNGGYGVIWDPATGVWTDPGSGNVFVPGIPVGLPPSSTIIGTIEDLVTDPIGTITEKVENVLGDIVSDPGGFVEQILTGALEVPANVWDMILGGVAVGQDLYDWLIENGVETVEETTPEPPLGGEEEDEPDDNALDDTTEDTETTEERDPIQQAVTDILGNILGSLEPEPEPKPEPEDAREEQIQDSVLDLLGGARGGVDSDMSQEDDLLAGVEDGTEGGFTFGGESFVPQDELTEEEKQEAIEYLTDQLEEEVGDPDDVVSEDPTDLTPDPVLDEPISEEETPLSGSAPTGGGGGAGRGSAQSEDFLRGLSYTPLQIAPIPARPLVDYTAGLFTQPTSRMSGLQLGGITAGLFGDMIG